MMRGEVTHISEVLDELEAICQEASSVPMRRSRAVVDRTDMLVLLDELRGMLPAELREAQSVHRECGAVIAGAEEEARRIVENARERAESLALSAEPYRRAQQDAEEVVERAERYAEEVAGGAEAYRDRILGQLEDWFQDSLASIDESRRELNNAALRQPVRYDPSSDEDTGEGWRASSA